MPVRIGYAYIAPALGVMFAVLYFPSIYGFYYSLFDVQYLLPTEFIGFYNYVSLLQEPELAGIVVRTFVFAALAVSATLALALLVASWIDSLTGWVAVVVQVGVIIPWVISNVVQALLFKWVFVNEIGLGVYLLEQIGVKFTPLGDGTTAMALLIVFATWRALGFAVIILLAGLKSIPADYYEAADVDGATRWQSFRYITLPQLKTPILITTVILTLSNLNNVETPLIVTGGGPAGATNIVPLELYMRAFASFDFNSAIAMAIGMFIANIVLVLAYVRLTRWQA